MGIIDRTVSWKIDRRSGEFSIERYEQPGRPLSLSLFRPARGMPPPAAIVWSADTGWSRSLQKSRSQYLERNYGTWSADMALGPMLELVVGSGVALRFTLRDFFYDVFGSQRCRKISHD